MDNAKEFLKQQNIMPKISFKDGKVHTITLISDKMDKITDTDGNEISGVTFLVEEDNYQKEFFTASISLISKLAEFKKGDMVTIKMNKIKTERGYKSGYSVVGGEKLQHPECPEEETEEEIDIGDIPF